MELIRRWCIVLIGGAVVAVGLLLMPLPGPGGLPVTIAGLAILSSELPWARRLLRRLKQRFQLVPSKRSGTAGWLKLIAIVVGLVALWIIGGIVVWRVWAF